MATRVLILDDEVEFCEELGDYLRAHGFNVAAIQDPKLFDETVERFDPELLLLDQFLGRTTASELLAGLRVGNDLPCIIVTGRSDPTERIVHLELGADDEVAKTVHPRELLARIRSVLRRSQPRATNGAPAAPSVPARSWRFVADRRELYRPDGRQCHLTTAEFETLNALVAANGSPVSRNELGRIVFRRDLHSGDRAVDTIIRKLRQKIERPGEQSVIKTVRQLGYVFVGFPDSAPDLDD